MDLWHQTFVAAFAVLIQLRHAEILPVDQFVAA
jgi:hypothetical protein